MTLFDLGLALLPGLTDKGLGEGLNCLCCDRERERERERDRQTYRQTDRQTGRQTDRQTNKQTDRQTPQEGVSGLNQYGLE